MFLMQSAYQFTQKGVALFALAGLAGAAVAPLAGRFADKGFGRLATRVAFVSGIVAFVLNIFIEPGSTWGLVLLVLTANLLDAAVSAHLVLGQRAVFMIDPANQSRLNGLYLAIIYVGGAVGSALGTYVFTHGSWTVANAMGACLPLIALACLGTERIFNYSEQT
jgi:predicted MFS family arabinose efflux permease